jgi:hypothetical protein
MESLIFRTRPNDRNESDQWVVVRDSDDDADYVVQERLKLDTILSGQPYARLIRRMTVDEFLATDQPPVVKGQMLKLKAAQHIKAHMAFESSIRAIASGRL